MLKTSAQDRRAVFLDRDGVLTRAIVRDGRPYAPCVLDDFKIVAEAKPAMTRLKGAGFLLIVVTNQPDLARGQLTENVLAAMNKAMTAALPIDDVFVCGCLEEDENCDCYKPRPGMLHAAAKKWDIALNLSFLIGDRWRDIGAGKAAGCRTVFIDNGYTKDHRPDRPDVEARSLTEACDRIIADR
ncbi:HAD-IIIA family hydrolase [Alphaproteobacteria bacterium]|nr:HAD-IIIA family hydrolase [Alphaproteobacteria bacterium]